ncbi:MAG: hypothetical protein ACKVVP_20595 [Chloroflexota bacterium]
MTTQVRTGTALDRFVQQTRTLFDSEPDLGARWGKLTPLLRELIADPEVIEASHHWPDCVPVDGRAENLLFYEDPDHKFAINGLVISAAGYGSANRIHDHAHIYTLYGLLDGHQSIERYERLDDRSRPDYAEIRTISVSHCGPGEIDLVPPFEIHRETSVGERAVAVIIRSEKSGGFNQGRYLPESNGYYESLGPQQTPCVMLPER